MAENRIFRNQPPAGQRPTEDRERMAAEAAAQFDAEEAELLGRRREARPLRRMLDATERNLTEVGGIMNPNLPLQLDRRNVAAAARDARRAAAAAPAASGRSMQDREGTAVAADQARTVAEASRPASTAPARQSRPAAPSGRRSGVTQRRRGELTADELNQISLDLARGQRMGPLAPGAEQNIARAMGYKKGGLVGKKAGPAAVAKKSAAKPVAKKKGGIVGALKAKTGRPVGRPASGVKPFGTQKMAAAMQGRKPVAMSAFKKGGKVSAKGKKK